MEKYNNSKIVLLPLDSLINCPFGRDIKIRAVNKIVKEWDERAFGILLVGHINDTYMVIEGNHRVEAIRQIDDYEAVWCQVLENITVEEAADIYIKINQNRRQLTRYDIYKAGIMAGDSKWIGIDQAIKKAGMKAAKSSKSGDSVSSIAMIENIYIKYGDGVLVDTLRAIHSIWFGDKMSKRSEFIGGMAYLINYTNEVYRPNGFSLEELTDKLKYELPMQILGKYLSRVSSGAKCESSWATMATVLSECYNKSKRSENTRFPVSLTIR